MEFRIEKYVMFIMRRGKGQVMRRIELPNQEKKSEGEKENYKYLGILEADVIKQAEMKEKIRKEYLRRTRELPETKSCSRSLIKEINTRISRRVEFSGEEVIVLPLAFIASLFVDELRSRQLLNGCM